MRVLSSRDSCECGDCEMCIPRAPAAAPPPATARPATARTAGVQQRAPATGGFGRRAHTRLVHPQKPPRTSSTARRLILRAEMGLDASDGSRKMKTAHDERAVVPSCTTTHDLPTGRPRAPTPHHPRRPRPRSPPPLEQQPVAPLPPQLQCAPVPPPPPTRHPAPRHSRHAHPPLVPPAPQAARHATRHRRRSQW